MIQMIKKEFALRVRSSKSIIILTILPIFFLFLFKWIFGSYFSTEMKIPDIRVSHEINSEEKYGKNLIDLFQENNQRIRLNSKVNLEKGVRDVRLNESDVFIEIFYEVPQLELEPATENDESDGVNKNSEEGEDLQGRKSEELAKEVQRGTIRVNTYINSIKDIKGRIVDGIIRAFSFNYKALESIDEINPSDTKKIDMESRKDFVIIKNIESEETPTALDYYGITMILCLIMLGVITSALAMREDRSKKMEKRIQLSSVKITSLYVAKFISCICIIALQMSFLFIFFKFVLRSEFGDDYGVIFLIFITTILFAVSLGFLIGSMFRKKGTVIFISSIVSFTMFFTGGGFAPIGKLYHNEMVLKVMKYSIVKKANNLIFSIIYSQNYSMLRGYFKISLIGTLIFGVFGIMLLYSDWNKSKRRKTHEKNPDNNQ